MTTCAFQTLSITIVARFNVAMCLNLYSKIGKYIFDFSFTSLCILFHFFLFSNVISNFRETFKKPRQINVLIFLLIILAAILLCVVLFCSICWTCCWCFSRKDSSYVILDTRKNLFTSF
jgi:hypothetical protein